MIATYPKRHQALAVLLSALAGYVDALGFLALGGLFVSFMSGNSTQFAVGLGSDPRLAGLAAGLVGSFFAGVVAGALVAGRAGRRRKPVVLVLVAVSLLVAALLATFGEPDLTPFLLAFAMGAENAVFLRDGEVAVGVTYMTGALVKTGHRLAARLQGEADAQWVAHLQLWLGLVAGAFVGALAFHALGLRAVWPAVVATLALATFAAPVEAH